MCKLVSTETLETMFRTQKQQRGEISWRKIYYCLKMEISQTQRRAREAKRFLKVAWWSGRSRGRNCRRAAIRGEIPIKWTHGRQFPDSQKAKGFMKKGVLSAEARARINFPSENLQHRFSGATRGKESVNASPRAAKTSLIWRNSARGNEKICICNAPSAAEGSTFGDGPVLSLVEQRFVFRTLFPRTSLNERRPSERLCFFAVRLPFQCKDSFVLFYPINHWDGLHCD